MNYEAAGASDDWAKGAAGVKYSYTIELPDALDGKHRWTTLVHGAWCMVHGARCSHNNEHPPGSVYQPATS